MFRRIYIILAVAMLPIFISGCKSRTAVVGNGVDNEQHSAMYTALETMIVSHPHMSLCDVYKSCFQDYFGPAHAIADSSSVKRYIEQELSQATWVDSCYYEPCGWRGNYYRVNMTVLRDGLMTTDDYTRAFMRSMPEVTPTVDAQWIGEWQEIERTVVEVVRNNAHAIPRMSPLIKDFDTDKATIAGMLSQGNYVMHHSESYSNAYHPHYRIVSKEIFLNEILPLLP